MSVCVCVYACICVCLSDHEIARVCMYVNEHLSPQEYRHICTFRVQWVCMSLSVCVCVCLIEPSSSSVSGLKRLWDEWKQRIKERLHVWPCIILDILNTAFVEMGAAYKKWHCAQAERACGLNSMTNLSPPHYFIQSSPDFMSSTFLLHSVTLSWMDNFKDF